MSDREQHYDYALRAEADAVEAARLREALAAAEQERDAYAAALSKVTHAYSRCDPTRCRHIKVWRVEHCYCATFERSDPVHQTPAVVCAALARSEGDGDGE